ncbi:Nuclear transport factor 2 (NTF2) family protein [Forsythia ovata]|uniref:Nuclear transport factor 2 (NTF2) family protein n=1 Tax=Forsythia ovata TaxID=205694 RepID=A0ABD1W3C9_9LAMI
MAAITGFPRVATGKTHIRIKTVARHAPGAMPLKRTRLFEQAEIKKPQQLIFTTKEIKRKPLIVFAASSGDSNINIGFVSPAHIIIQLYSAINEKNLKKLEKLIAKDCFFDDYSFPTPFQGKKEALQFLDQLIACMGQNMKFNIEHIWQGDEFTAGANWHLDWNKIQVPFTRGCSYYKLSSDGDRLVIKEARVLIESPIKLGGVALTLFKTLTFLFDAFPAATEWFLKSPHIMFQLLHKSYKIAVEPIITPLFTWYIRLMNFAACILAFTLKILYYLAKIFNM